MKQPILKIIILFSFLNFIAFSCNKENVKNSLEKPQFELLTSEKTGINFQNTLTEALNTNILMYEYFYNGGGVAVGDFNSDGLEDIYFTSNMAENKMFLNKGNLKFQDITETSHAAGRSGPWKTGVTIVDINNDGKLDIYLCYSGAMPSEKRRNELFVNQGNDSENRPFFVEEAAKYGIDSPGFSNQAYFFDYDNDQDLDMILMNHNPKNLPILNEASTKEFRSKDDQEKGLRLFQQDNSFFNDITQTSGIDGSALSYGLGVGLADMNNDGWLDFYVSNDYAVPDFLYINMKNGKFQNQIEKQIGHTSQFSMGNDVADINNDGFQDIFTLDMLPEDNKRQKLLIAPDNFGKFDLNLQSGFYYQYMRNMLQINNGNDSFSEVGQLAGISSTDWSWSALWADYNNDGWKDLYVTNGYYRDYTNLDFIKYMEDFVKEKGRLVREDVLEIIGKMPASNIENYVFQNVNGETFKNKSKDWGIARPSNSNGAAYADFDNDGDLDLIVNNINQDAFLYENKGSKYDFLTVSLKGNTGNTLGIGAKVEVFSEGKQQTIFQNPTRGYLSSVSPNLHFGLGNSHKIDSLKITWNSGKVEKIFQPKSNQTLLLKEENANSKNKLVKDRTPIFKYISSTINYTHDAWKVRDFDRQPLLINELSFSGPAMTKGDINQDGLEDVIIGGSFGQITRVFLQNKNGNFLEKIQNCFDSTIEVANLILFDANKDGFLDLYCANGGFHSFTSTDEKLQDELFLNDGKGNFTKKTLPKMLTSSAALAIEDINKDGFLDVFVGGRSVPGKYPESPNSYILINDGKGNFSNKTKEIAPEIDKLGMITDALWVDLDGDKSNELVIVGEWMPILVFKNNKGKLIESTKAFFEKSYSGWWNIISVFDCNKDGKPDILLGNQGVNGQCVASDFEPAEIQFADFDDNGQTYPIFSFYMNGELFPYITRDELLQQISSLRSEFPTYESYSNVNSKQLLNKKPFGNAQKFEINTLETKLFLSTTKGKFKEEKLPIQAQYAPVYSIEIGDFTQDGNQDIVLFGNNSHTKLRFGKFDANYGTLLTGNGKGNFSYISQSESGLKIFGDVRSTLQINQHILVGKNGGKLETYRWK